MRCGLWNWRGCQFQSQARKLKCADYQKNEDKGRAQDHILRPQLMVTARIGKKATDQASTAYFGMGVTRVFTKSSGTSVSAGLHTMSVFTFSCRPFQTKAPLLTSTTHEPTPTLPKLSPSARP